MIPQVYINFELCLLPAGYDGYFLIRRQLNWVLKEVYYVLVHV